MLPQGRRSFTAGGTTEDAIFDTLHHSIGGEDISGHEETLSRLLHGKGLNERSKDQQHTDHPKGISMAMVPPFIRFLRRNEELLARKVSQLSIMLREAKGGGLIDLMHCIEIRCTVLC